MLIRWRYDIFSKIQSYEYRTISLIEIDSEYLMLIKISSSASATDRDTCIAFTYLPTEGSDYSDNDSFFP